MKSFINFICDVIEVFMTVVFGIKIWTMIDGTVSILGAFGIFSMLFLSLLFVIDVANDIANGLYRLADK